MMTVCFPLEYKYKSLKMTVLYLDFGLIFFTFSVSMLSVSYYIFEGHSDIPNPTCLFFDIGFKSYTLGISTITFVCVQLVSLILIIIYHRLIIVSLKPRQSRMSSAKSKATASSPMSSHVISVTITNMIIMLVTIMYCLFSLTGWLSH